MHQRRVGHLHHPGVEFAGDLRDIDEARGLGELEQIGMVELADQRGLAPLRHDDDGQLAGIVALLPGGLHEIVRLGLRLQEVVAVAGA